MSFFIRNKYQRGTKRPHVAENGGRKFVSKYKKSNDDEEISSHSEDDNEELSEKEDEEAEETAQEKRIRLTKEYLKQIEIQGIKY